MENSLFGKSFPNNFTIKRTLKKIDEFKKYKV